MAITDDDFKQLQLLVDDLNKRVTAEEKKPLEFHTHTGTDSPKVRVRDLQKVFYKEFTYDPGSLADGVGETKQVTGVSGANLGDFVLVSAPYDLQDITVTAYVQATDVVELRLQNEGAATVDLASGTWRILVIKKLV